MSEEPLYGRSVRGYWPLKDYVDISNVGGFGWICLQRSPPRVAIQGCCCRANMAHVRQSRPEYGLGFQVKVLKPFYIVPSSLGSGSGGSACRGDPLCAKTGVPRSRENVVLGGVGFVCIGGVRKYINGVHTSAIGRSEVIYVPL